MLLVALLYGTELLDELIYGIQSAVLPSLKSDLALTYTQLGLMFTVPGLISLVGDPLIGLAGDTRHRRALIVGGMALTCLGLVLVGIGQTFLVILLAYSILYIASGAYVSLSQASLIDRDLGRAEKTMARVAFLGYLGQLLGPLLVTALLALGYSWRGLYLGLSASAGLYAALLFRQTIGGDGSAEEFSLRALIRNLLDALREPELWRWVILAEFADLMLDKLLEMTGLYFDFVGVGAAGASGAVALSTAAGLLGNLLLVPVLERTRGQWLLRWTALATLAMYVAFLLVPVIWLKLLLIGVLRIATAGWYPVLRAQTYQALPGQSGLIISVTALGSLIGLATPLLLGRVADTFGIQSAMWLLALGPVALLVGMPHRRKDSG